MGGSVEREMRIANARLLQRSDDTIEIGHARHGTDAHTIHPAAPDDIISHEDLAVAAAAQFLGETFSIDRVGEGARLNEERADRGGGHGGRKYGGGGGGGPGPWERGGGRARGGRG